MSRRRIAVQRRFGLDLTEETQVQQDVEDALRATWESVWANRVPGELLGVPTAFAGLADLIAMKEAAGRAEKDLPDLRRLRELQDRQSAEKE